MNDYLYGESMDFAWLFRDDCTLDASDPMVSVLSEMYGWENED